MSNQRIRPAVRGLVMDHDNHILMVKLVFPHGSWWVLPGGGIDDGEDHHSALHRELHEETGLRDATIGAPVWNRVHLFQMTDTEGRHWDGQQETVYMVRTERFTPQPHFSDAELQRENLFEHKWWSVSELLAYNGTDNFSPPDLASFVHVVVNNGVPVTPFEIFHSS